MRVDELRRELQSLATDVPIAAPEPKAVIRRGRRRKAIRRSLGAGTVCALVGAASVLALASGHDQGTVIRTGRVLTPPESVCAHARAAQQASLAQLAARVAARIRDTSGMWRAAECIVHLIGGTTSSGVPWVFTVTVLPHLNGGPTACPGLWVGPQSQGYRGLCGSGPLAFPHVVDFQSFAVPTAHGARFVICSTPLSVGRIALVLGGHKTVSLVTTGAKLGISNLFAVGVLPANRPVQRIVVLDHHGRRLGMTRGVIQTNLQQSKAPQSLLAEYQQIDQKLLNDTRVLTTLQQQQTANPTDTRLAQQVTQAKTVVDSDTVQLNAIASAYNDTFSPSNPNDLVFRNRYATYPGPGPPNGPPNYIVRATQLDQAAARVTVR